MTRLFFNMLLDNAGIHPNDVRLLRHQKAVHNRKTPYSLWRDDPVSFEVYQSCQKIGRAAYFGARYWASFVVPPDGTTLFVGVYEMGSKHPVPDDWIDPLSGENIALRRDHPCELHDFRRMVEFDHYAGRLRILWGDGTRSWVQRPDNENGNKEIVELTQFFREAEFPGYSAFISNLFALPNLPAAWVGALQAGRGVYLLTCPRTREQYVGAAYGATGFWGRWQNYIANSHGGNLGLKSRDPSDYQVSILEIAGSSATAEDIIALEQHWKNKLQSREMGLNHN